MASAREHAISLALALFRLVLLPGNAHSRVVEITLGFVGESEEVKATLPSSWMRVFWARELDTSLPVVRCLS
jgi:hypothetical protein